MHILLATIPFLALFLCAFFGALDYLFIKYHLFIQRRVVRYCIKRFDARILYRQHKTNAKYHPCKIWIGSDYGDGYNPTLRTVSSDILFSQTQSKQQIFEQIICQFAEWKFEILVKNDHAIHVKKNNYKFVISIIPVTCGYEQNYECYRFIFTWVQN